MLNASPTSTPLQTSVRQRPFSLARTPASQARIISKINSVSTLVVRETATNDGNTASASAPATAAQPPSRRASARYISSTASIPRIASGSSRLSGEKPNSFALAVCTHRPSGGLSTETRPPGSNDTKKKLCSERSIDLSPAE